MRFPVKHMFWALVGGALSGWLAFSSGLSFWLSSVIVLAGLVLADFLVHTWRIHKFTIAVCKTPEEVRDYVKSRGNELMIGTRKELLALCGVAYKLYDNFNVHPWYDHFCMLNSQTEKEIMGKYNASRTKNLIYWILEFLF